MHNGQKSPSSVALEKGPVTEDIDPSRATQARIYEGRVFDFAAVTSDECPFWVESPVIAFCGPSRAMSSWWVEAV